MPLEFRHESVRGHSRSSKAALFDREHTNLYSSSIINANYLLMFQRYSRIGWKSLPFPLVFGALAVKPSDLRNDPWWRKTRRMILSESERILMICSAVLIQSTHGTDRRTYGRKCRSIYTLSIYAVARKKSYMTAWNCVMFKFTNINIYKWPSCLLGMADRIAHSRRSVQKLWRINLAMLIYRDRGGQG